MQNTNHIISLFAADRKVSKAVRGNNFILLQNHQNWFWIKKVTPD